MDATLDALAQQVIEWIDNSDRYTPARYECDQLYTDGWRDAMSAVLDFIVPKWESLT